MEECLYQKINDSVDTVFAYALKRTNNRYEAEDLSQEIILNLYNSLNSLKDKEKFYGWMWAVAGNVYKGYLRKKKQSSTIDLNQNIYTSNETPENEIINKEEIGTLYRELSRLSGLYRETMTLYYIEEKSCEDIANRLSISMEMVKQYLFKSRKKIKDGMSMIRETGEKSFNPKKFNIYYWGTGYNYCVELFRRKLPGNILIGSYYEPVSLEDLSIELGVSTVYLEDEVNILLNNGLVKKVRNNKLQSNIIIFTKEFEKELLDKTTELYGEITDFFVNHIMENETKIRSIGFKGSEANSNTFFWQMATVCLRETIMNKFVKEVLSEYPLLSDGSSGYMWGLERKYGDNKFDMGIHHYTEGDNTIWLFNFFCLPRKIHLLSNKETAEVLFKIAKGEKMDVFNQAQKEIIADLIKENYAFMENQEIRLYLPFYTTEQYKTLMTILEPLISRLHKGCKDILPITEKILKKYVPSYLHDQIPPIAALKQVEAFVHHTMENLEQKGHISIPDKPEDLGSVYLVVQNP